MVVVETLVVYCADVGSIAQSNFGWARSEIPAGGVQEHHGGEEIAELVERVAADLTAGKPVALGFECPVFVPVPDDWRALGKSRPGDGSRSFSAGAGPAVLVTGLFEMPWILGELRKSRPDDSAYIDWESFAQARSGLFLWEAFVTGPAKKPTHVEDAAEAVRCFRAALPDPRAASAVTAENPLSVIAAALLWSDWSSDLDLLHEPCLVIKAAPVEDG